MSHVVIVQPVIPKYRMPFFAEVAATPGYDVTLLADVETERQLNQYDPGSGIPVRNLPLKQFGPFMFRPGLRRQLREFKPDAVILQGNQRDITQLRAVSWCKRRGIPVGVWSMFYRIGRRKRWTEAVYRWLGRKSDVLLSYGERGYREQVARGTPSEKIIVLYNSIDEQKIIETRDRVNPPDIETFRREQGLDGKKVILHLVRLTQIKRPDLMLQGFQKLLQRRKEVVLVFIGGGPLEEEIKAMAIDMGVMEHCRFMGPIYDEERLALWYSIADVFAIATCIGLSIHHAMCYGVPVVTDDNDMTQTAEFEVLVDGENGLTYRSGDMDDFAAKMERIISDSDLRARLSLQARRRIQEDYSLERMVSHFREGMKRLTT